MICRKCGSNMPEGLRYCGNCGRKMGIIEYALHTKKLLVPVVIVLVLALVAVGVLAFRGAGERVQISEELLQQSLERQMRMTQTAEEGTPAYLLAMEELSVYTVTGYEMTADDTAVARVDVSAPDLYSVIKGLENRSFASDAEMDAALVEGIRAAAVRETELEITFCLEDGMWVPVLTDAFVDAYYGGILTYQAEVYAEWEGQE